MARIGIRLPQQNEDRAGAGSKGYVMFNRVRKLFRPKDIPVPIYDYFAHEFTYKEKDFYQYWLAAWKKGYAIDINYQYSYLFIYLRELIESNSPERIIKEAKRLKLAYPLTEKKGSKSFHSYSSRYIADSYIWLDKITEAIGELYKGLNSHYSFLEVLLSLKQYVGEDISGREVVNFYNAKTKLTKLGRENIVSVENCIDLILEAEKERMDSTVLAYWLKDYQQMKPEGLLWEYIPLLEKRKTSEIPYYYIFHLAKVNEDVHRWMREGENLFRDQKNIPRIGEGWVSETELYYKLKETFTDLDVVHHASPEWLGRQHLDIFMPKLKFAIEYQGKQHDEPVNFFGGDEAFEKTKERDMKKKTLCEENDVKLMYVRPGYDFEQVVATIKSILQDRT